MALDTGGLAISTIGSTGSIYCYIPKVHFPDAVGNKDLCEESSYESEFTRIRSFTADFLTWTLNSKNDI